MSCHTILVARLREDCFREACVGASEVTAFWWFALARKWFSGRECWWERSQGVLVARVGEMLVFGRRALAGAKSQRFGSSLWREDGFRETGVGGSEVTAVWWLTLARRWFSGVVLVGAKFAVPGRTHREQAVFVGF